MMLGLANIGDESIAYNEGDDRKNQLISSRHHSPPHRRFPPIDSPCR